MKRIMAITLVALLVFGVVGTLADIILAKTGRPDMNHKKVPDKTALLPKKSRLLDKTQRTM